VAFYYLCRGIDERSVAEETSVKSISREHTFNADSFDREEWQKTLHALSEDIARRARQQDVKGQTVFITYRTPDFRRHTRQRTLLQPTNVAKLIYEKGLEILHQIQERSLRLIGIGISGLYEEVQTNLFEEPAITKKLEISEYVADSIRRKFGDSALKKGLEIDGKKNCQNRSN